jgi:hypothetical protein
MTNENENTNENTATAETPKLSFYHPNGRGTGCAVQFELHPAHGAEDGYIMATFAKQKTVGARDGNAVTYPRFDWANKITVKLYMGELMEMLQTFRGCQKSIQDGKGIFQRTEEKAIVFNTSHRIEPQPSYCVEVSQRLVGSDEIDRAYIMLTISEGLALSLCIEQSLGLIAFGVPHGVKFGN